MGKSATTIRFAAVGDLHVTKDSAGTLRAFFAQAAEAADALLLCGDLTDYGTAEEAQVLAEELGAVAIPIVAVLGNHDYQSAVPEKVIAVLKQAGVRVLDGEVCEIEGVGIAGVKGFAGGFGRGSLGAWGEPAIKQFVQEALNEAMKLESALAKLRMPRRIALLRDASFRDAIRHSVEHPNRDGAKGPTLPPPQWTVKCGSMTPSSRPARPTAILNVDPGEYFP